MEVRKGYKQTEVGVIPEDWDIKTLGRLVLSVEYGSSAKSSTQGKMPVLRMGNLQGGKIDWADLVYTNNDFEINKYQLRKGDVLFNRTNTIELVGKTSFYNGERPAIFAGYLIRINANISLLDSRFLNYILNAEFARKYSSKVLSIAVGQANINGQKLKTYPIPLPPTLAEQEAIAEALSDADAMIESLETLLTKKHQVKQGAMSELFSGKKRLPGFNGEWRRKNIKTIAQTPVTDGPHLTPVFLDDGIPFLSVNNIVDNVIDWSNLRYISLEDHQVFSKKCKPQKNDILLGKAASVGKVAIVETDREFNIWSPIAMIRISKEYNPKFIYYSLQTRDISRQIEILTNSSSQGNIGMGEIEKIEVPLPEKDEQTAIAEILSDMDAEIRAVEEKLVKARQVKAGMMSALLTGRVRLV